MKIQFEHVTTKKTESGFEPKTVEKKFRLFKY